MGAADRRTSLLAAACAALGPAACAALGLAACSDEAPSLPAPSAHVVVESVTEVEVDDDGLAVLTFAAQEHYRYLVRAVGGTATFGEPGEIVAGVQATSYSSPGHDETVVVRGEPGAEVLVSLQRVDGVGIGLGERVSVELAVGDCAWHPTATGGVAEVVAVFSGDVDRLTREQPDDGSGPALEERTDADGNPVFTTDGDDHFGFHVCNTSDGTARYEVRTEEHLEPGEQPAPRSSVDGRPSVSGAVRAGEVRIHTVFVPAGYEATLRVVPDQPDFHVELFLSGSSGARAHVRGHGGGEPETLGVRGAEPTGSVAAVVVRQGTYAPALPVATYTLSVG